MSALKSHTIFGFLFFIFARHKLAGVVDCMDGTDEHECDNTHEGSSNATFVGFIDFFPNATRFVGTNILTIFSTPHCRNQFHAGQTRFSAGMACAWRASNDVTATKTAMMAAMS